MADSECSTVVIRQLGLMDYETVWKAMSDYTDTRDGSSDDEIWLVEHPPVFTQGQAGKAEHVLMPGDIPVVQVDRGGQVTYHGPGQLVAYPLVDLRRLGIGVRNLVTAIEQSIVDTLSEYQLLASPKADAPGVYIDGDKIASLGLRVRRGCSFHGLSLNVAMDLEPFLRINPCGYQDLKMIQLQDFLDGTITVADVQAKLAAQLMKNLKYEKGTWTSGLQSAD